MDSFNAAVLLQKSHLSTRCIAEAKQAAEQPSELGAELVS